MDEHPKLFINGQFAAPLSGETFDVINPADLSSVGQAPRGNREDARRALEAASRAGITWGTLGNVERGNILESCIQAVRGSIEPIAALLNAEHGKPISEAEGEVKGTLLYLKYFAEQAKRVQGDNPPDKSRTMRSLVIKQPRGVVAAITPWNYPLALAGWKVGSALAAGCTLVLKPPSDTPLSVLKFFSEFALAGLPDGVLNIVPGPAGEVGDELITHPLTKVIAFTGSTETGKKIKEKTSGQFVKLILELGGQTPLVIFKDADLDKAVPLAVKRSFRNMGQICNAVNRIYIEEPLMDEFIPRFIAGTEQLRIGYGAENRDYDLGPMTNQEGLERVKTHIQDAVNKGGNVILGGGRPDSKSLPDGYFFLPTIITDTTPDMLVMREESFGPIVGVDSFNGMEEALQKANSTRYGLVAYAFTNNLKTAFQFMEQAQFGSVAINTVSPDSPYAPYPAWKESGMGIELGERGLDEFLKIKHCLVDVG